MRDAISELVVAKLHPKIKDEVKGLIDKAEAKLGQRAAIRIVQGLRTIAEQDALYAKGRSKPGPKVTNSRGGQSYHNYGLAIDFAVIYDKDANGTYESLSWDILKDFDHDGEADWMEVVDTFETAGYTWGGRFHSITDNPHFEKTFGFNWRYMLLQYTEKNFIPGTEYINI